MNISVSDFSAGLELNGKHFDTKIEFQVNNQKVVMHYYNSTQNLKVEGSVYLDFIDKYLKYFFLLIQKRWKQK